MVGGVDTTFFVNKPEAADLVAGLYLMIVLRKGTLMEAQLLMIERDLASTFAISLLLDV